MKKKAAWNSTKPGIDKLKVQRLYPCGLALTSNRLLSQKAEEVETLGAWLLSSPTTSAKWTLYTRHLVSVRFEGD